MPRIRRAAIAALVVTAAAILLACGSSSDSSHMSGMMKGQPEGSIRVNLVNWAVEPAVTTAKAGSVTFWAQHDMAHMHGANEGGAIHDLQVMKKNSDGSMELVGQVQGLKMGEAKALTLTLAPGDYELACNVVETVDGKPIGHYAKGMHTAFTVTS